MERTEIINAFYSTVNEDERLCRNRQGQLEYRVTTHFIHKYLKPGDSVLELGTGTGRYSVALAKEGAEVTAVELLEVNLAKLKENANGLPDLRALRGDALDLSRFSDGTFDLTLVFGPMYHLYGEAERYRAIDEAIRVTKPGGTMLFAFLSAHAIICTNYLYRGYSAVYGITENFDKDYNAKHFKEQLFTGYDIREFEDMFAGRPVEHITTAAVDNVLEIAQKSGDFMMTDEDFEAFADYQIHICEKREMLGNSSHLLYICRKNDKKENNR